MLLRPLCARISFVSVVTLTGLIAACGSTRDGSPAGSGGSGNVGGGGSAASGNIPTGPVGDGTAIGTWRERILAKDGSIDWDQWLYVANHYHEEEIVDYRLGPKRSDYGDMTARDHVDQPDPLGLWKGGTDAALADAFCQTSDKLPKNEAEEAALYDGGGAWIESGQLLFSPRKDHPDYTDDFRLGVSNARNFDAAMARKNEGGTQITRGLCMRQRAGWYPDWWNRNGISVPASPGVEQAQQVFPSLPLPAVATARGGAQSSVTGFLAFQSGFIMAAGTGNDGYDGVGTDAYPTLQLAEGKVPTALAVTSGNEFILATVWDTKQKRGQVAVIAVGSVGPPATVPDGWGVHNWPTVTGLKLLGYVDLPFVAPMAIGVATTTPARSLRGTTVVEDGALLITQAQRDLYRNLPWDQGGDDTFHKTVAHSGYAIVSSRAENKVAILDLRPLLSFYRDMYLTTQEKFDATRVANQGPGDAQWPTTFAHDPAQTPLVLGTIDVPRPTAVLGRTLPTSTNVRAYDEIKNITYSNRTTIVASMDGTVRLYDVESLMDPTKTPTPPSAPVYTTQVGENPVQIAEPIAGDAKRDDLFVVSRGRGSIHALNYRLDVLDVLKDDRLVDPVYVAIGSNGAGYGGSGKGYTVGARVLTVLDHDGMQVVDYGMALEPSSDATGDEEWPFLDPAQKRVRFQLGFANPLPGKPFMFSFDEVI
jgi:hypothetical protein